ncbi:ABC transporter substrate-binding protein, partial [Gluconobacter morbifer]|uniref:ABC transporter substrate-binding protein n=1 Tax=Gluconobacter morbifer TaxID=479935 RepID=UPI0006819187
MMLAAVLLTVSARAAHPRFISLNLCTDQLLLELADPADIAGLSPLATDCAESVLCRKARGFPIQRAGGEDLITAHPTVVFDGTWRKPTVSLVTDALHVPLVQLSGVTGLKDIPTQIRTVARAIHEQDRGERLIQAFEARLATLHPAHPEKILSVAVIGANMTDEGTGLMQDLLTLSGFHPLASQRADGTMPLEQLVARSPDLVVTALISEGP